MVLSLWKVPDLATLVLMDRFYRHLEAALPRHQALHRAQIEVRELTVEDLREEGWLNEETITALAARDDDKRARLDELAAKPSEHQPYADPVYWGAFLCQGKTEPIKDMQRG